MLRASALLIAVAGVINLVPITGVVSVSRLADLYGIAVAGPDLEILMRHRAVVLGTTGILLLVSVFRTRLRNVAAVIGFASMLSFEAISMLVGDANANLSRIAAADWVGIVALALGMGLDRLGRAKATP